MLYLTAFLLLAGRSGSDARRMGHDLAVRAELATAGELALRRRTMEHLREIERDREYFAVRYAPERLPRPFHANRLVATLADVGDKVAAAVVAAAPPVNARGVAVPSSAAAWASVS